MKRKHLISIITILALLFSTTLSFATNSQIVIDAESNEDVIEISLPDGDYSYTSELSENGRYVLHEYKNGILIYEINGTIGESEATEIEYDCEGNASKSLINLADYVKIGVDEETATQLLKDGVNHDLFEIDKSTSCVTQSIKSLDSEASSNSDEDITKASTSSWTTKGKYCYKKGYDYNLKKDVKHKGYFKYKTTGSDNVSYKLNAKKGTKVTVIAATLMTALASLVGFGLGASVLVSVVYGICSGAGVSIVSEVIQSKLSTNVAAKATYYKTKLVKEDGKTAFPANPYKSTKYVITSKKYSGKTIYEGVVPQEWKGYAKRLFQVFYSDGYNRTKYPGVEKYVTY